MIRRRSISRRAELTFHYRASDPASRRARDAIYRVVERDLGEMEIDVVEVEASQSLFARELDAPLGYPWVRVVHESGLTVWRFGEVTVEELKRLLYMEDGALVSHPISKL